MPLYYFDVYDGDKAVRDAFGCEMDSAVEAAEQAAALLPDLARDDLPSGLSRDYAAFVRDDEGAPVYRAALLFRGEMLAGEAGRKPARRTNLSDIVARSQETRGQAARLSASIKANCSELLSIIEQATRTVEEAGYAAITRSLR